MERVGLPSGGSTLMTSAPSPASVRPQYSACSSAISMTRMPASDPGCAAGVLVTAFSGFGRRSIVTPQDRYHGGLGPRQLNGRGGIAGRQHRPKAYPSTLEGHCDSREIARRPKLALPAVRLLADPKR